MLSYPQHCTTLSHIPNKIPYVLEAAASQTAVSDLSIWVFSSRAFPMLGKHCAPHPPHAPTPPCSLLTFNLCSVPSCFCGTVPCFFFFFVLLANWNLSILWFQVAISSGHLWPFNRLSWCRNFLLLVFYSFIIVLSPVLSVSWSTSRRRANRFIFAAQTFATASNTEQACGCCMGELTEE